MPLRMGCEVGFLLRLVTGVPRVPRLTAPGTPAAGMLESRTGRDGLPRSPRVVPLPLPLPTERPPRCVWDTKPVLPHQEDVPVSTTSLLNNRL
jgi:hypothetical protein